MEIRLENVQTDYFKVSSFSLSAKEKLLIKGPSGSGKTTFLHLLAGLYRPSSGSVSWDGKSLAEYSEHALSELRRTRMGLIFQNLNLLSYLTATENIELSGASSADARILLTTVGLGEKITKRTQNLSLGEQQRVAVARVLAQKAEVILADEPTSSLEIGRAHV